MTINELVQELTRVAEQSLNGGDTEVILYDTNRDVEYRHDPDADLFDFEVTRGDEAVIEFKGLAGAPGGSGS